MDVLSLNTVEKEADFFSIRWKWRQGEAKQPGKGGTIQLRLARHFLQDRPMEVTQDLSGLKKLLARDYDINSTFDDLKRSIQRQGQERLRQRMEEDRAKTGEKGPAKLTKSITVPVKMTSAADIDTLIRQLHEIKAQLGLYTEIEVSLVVSDQLGTDRG
jgi:hypothetical protein